MVSGVVVFIICPQIHLMTQNIHIPHIFINRKLHLRSLTGRKIHLIQKTFCTIPPLQIEVIKVVQIFSIEIKLSVIRDPRIDLRHFIIGTGKRKSLKLPGDLIVAVNRFIRCKINHLSLDRISAVQMIRKPGIKQCLQILHPVFLYRTSGLLLRLLIGISRINFFLFFFFFLLCPVLFFPCRLLPQLHHLSGCRAPGKQRQDKNSCYTDTNPFFHNFPFPYIPFIPLNAFSIAILSCPVTYYLFLYCDFPMHQPFFNTFSHT